MGVTDRLLEGLAAGANPEAMMFIAAGIFVGILVGAAPGVGPTIGMAIMLPFAVRMDTLNAIFLLASINVGAAYGNSFPAILAGVPGSPQALLTVVEGRPFYERGEGGRALLVALVASCVAQLFGVLMFVAFAVPLAEIAIRLLFPEVFAVVVFGIVTATGLVTSKPWKGVAAIMIGLLLALPGPDPITGQLRFTFGQGWLGSGLRTVPVVLGLLAFREVFASAERGLKAPSSAAGVKLQYWLTKADWKAIAIPMVVAIVVGFSIGVIPGAGGASASFVAYQVMKSILNKRTDFGTGTVEGVAVVDGAGNASSSGELIPTLALGIPGSSAMVVLMAALGSQGVFVGPQLIATQPELLYAVFGGMMMGVVMLSVIGLLAIPPSVYLASLSPPATMAMTVVLVVTGTYALSWSMLDVWVALGAGVLGYVMTRFDYPVAPAALTFILGSLLERSLRRGLIMTAGWGGLLSRPITTFLLLAALSTFFIGVRMNRRQARATARQLEELTSDGDATGRTA